MHAPCGKEKLSSERSGSTPTARTGSPSADGIRAAYERNREFTDELQIVRANLRKIKGERAITEVERFLNWFDPRKRSLTDVVNRLTRFSQERSDILQHYIAFACRFDVLLRAKLDTNGKRKFIPDYPKPKASYLVSDFRAGKLVTRIPAVDPYDDVLSPPGTPAFAEGLRTRAIQFLELEIPSRMTREGTKADKSEILQLIDAAYDPFKLNVVIVRRRVSPLVFQTYLLCFVGDLTSAMSLDQLKSVKTALQKSLHGTTARGRTREAGSQTIIAALLKSNLDVKSSAIQVLEVGGQLSSGTGENDAKTIE